MESILKKLMTLSESDFYPYHMPGHKRNGASVFATDITEIDEFDNLHHATGILKEAQERTARLYGAKESFFLVNGSTCGLLAAIFASFQRGDKVLVARNCHKAVYHGLEIRGLVPIYLYPEQDEECDISVGITVEQISDRLMTCDDELKGVILTSPTYQGVTSELKEIAELLHRQDKILIVDEAHGAHFGFHSDFPKSAVTQGADIVIQSMHKTLPSMTQTALLHRCSERISSEKIQKYLGVFQTSSPSYVFMAYMDACIRLLENEGVALFQSFADKLGAFYKRCEELTYIKVRTFSDPGKMVITAYGYSGKEIYDILRNRYHLQLEMYAGNYALAIMTISDTAEGFERLYQALAKTDHEIAGRKNVLREDEKANEIKMTFASLTKTPPVTKCTPEEAEKKHKRKIKLENAGGSISGEYVYLYPPGIPFVVPGEEISDEAVKGLLFLQSKGYELQGMADITGEYLNIVQEVSEESWQKTEKGL